MSEWFGSDGGGPNVIDGNGSPLVGIAGSYKPMGDLLELQGLRLLQPVE
jgi:hypothetical protein